MKQFLDKADIALLAAIAYEHDDAVLMNYNFSDAELVQDLKLKNGTVLKIPTPPDCVTSLPDMDGMAHFAVSECTEGVDAGHYLDVMTIMQQLMLRAQNDMEHMCNRLQQLMAKAATVQYVEWLVGRNLPHTVERVHGWAETFLSAEHQYLEYGVKHQVEALNLPLTDILSKLRKELSLPAGCLPDGVHLDPFEPRPIKHASSIDQSAAPVCDGGSGPEGPAQPAQGEPVSPVPGA